jgi:membrane protease YdiL (CAAX protease family)
MGRAWKERLNDYQWVKKNKLRTYLLFYFPTATLIAPCLEEIVFRAPLILGFELWGPSAWSWVAVSSAIFGLWHLTGAHPGVAASALEEGVLDENGEEINDLERRVAIKEVEFGRAEMIVLKGSRAVVTGLLGAYFAYLAISHQSLYVAIGAHALWNAIGQPLVAFAFSIIMVVVMISLTFSQFVWEWVAHTIRERRRLRRHLKADPNNSCQSYGRD